MDEEKFWELLSVKLSGEASLQELAELDRMLQENPSLGLQAQMLTEMWKQQDNGAVQPDNFFDRHLQRLSNHPDIYLSPQDPQTSIVPNFGDQDAARRFRRRWLSFAGIAASLLIVLMAYQSGWFHSTATATKTDQIAKNTVSTRRGSKSSVQLPDGSLAWLNADSRLIYDENFRGDFREVTLEGEAFFDVVKDKARPFIIHTKTIDIRVLGTAFNVRAYATEKNTETSLFRGSVEVTLHNNPEKKIVLKPNEKLKVNNKSPQFDGATPGAAARAKASHDVNITVGKVHFEAKDSSALETLWIKNKLVFDAETLEQVAQKIERWYDVKVVISGDENLRNTEYSGIFDNENLSEVMEALKITGNFRYAINKSIVTIK